MYSLYFVEEERQYQWEIIIGVVLAIVLIIAFIVYVDLNMDSIYKLFVRSIFIAELFDQAINILLIFIQNQSAHITRFR